MSCKKFTRCQRSLIVSKSEEKQKGGYWLLSIRLGKYQSILLDNPNVTIKAASTLNYATLLLTSIEKATHDCIQMIEQVHSSCPDLMATLSEHPGLKVVIDASSFMDQGQCKARYAIVTHQEMLEAEALPPGPPAQKATQELFS